MPIEPKVYIVNKGAKDYTNAKQFGELIYLTDELIDKYDTNKLYMLFTKYLETSNSNDFIIITGLPVMSAIASSILASMHGKVNYLLFADGKYLERTVVYGD